MIEIANRIKDVDAEEERNRKMFNDVYRYAAMNLLYMPNTEYTRECARENIERYIIQQFGASRTDVTVDGRFYDDRLAQGASSYEHYKVLRAAAGLDPDEIPETEFYAR